MNELVRKALLGDKEAQEQCTLQGIALPCPKCYEDLVFENGFWRHPKNDCGFANLESKRLCVSLDLLEDWNTRPAPPIGRCGECRHWYENELNEYVCEILDISSDDNFYCSYFEPKEREGK